VVQISPPLQRSFLSLLPLLFWICKTFYTDDGLEADNILKGLLECTGNKGGGMKQSVIFLMILTFVGPLSVFAATLQNTDSQEYELQIKEEGRPYGSYYGPYGDEFRVLEHCKTDICHYGCEMTLLNTGQKVWVNPRDEVVISYSVMKVNRAANDRRGGY
jgi:hypothetical protein